MDEVGGRWASWKDVQISWRDIGFDETGSRTVRQSSVQRRKKASWRVSWRCSTSIRGSRCSWCVGGFDSASFVKAEVSEGGFHVAAEGMEGPDRAGVMTRPCVANMCSASSATAAMAAARSALNCLRSARRFAVISSEVISVWHKRTDEG